MALDISSFPELKPYQFIKLKKKYIAGVMTAITPAILYGFTHSSFRLDDSVVPLSTSKMRVIMGRVQVNGVKEYVWDLVQDKGEGVLVEMKKGSNITGEVGAFKISEWSHIMESINQMEVIKEVKEYIDKSNLPSIELDLPGLRALKLLLKKDLTHAKYESTQTTINRKLFFIEMLLEFCKDGKLNQYAERSTTGRLYLKGLNLQSAPKQVRSVALGKHYIYDFKACAFGVFTSLYHIICEDHGVDPYPHTRHLRDYITNRQKYRLKICRDMFWPTDMLVGMKPASDILKSKEYKQIKTAFTAIGFGAPARAGYYKVDPNKPGYTQTALTGIFKTWVDNQNVGKEVAKKFIEHEFVKGLVTELKEITKHILDFCLEEDPNLELIKGRPFQVDKGEKASKSRMLAHIYQGHETQLLEILYSYAGEDNTLLLLHDGLATKNKISNYMLVELKKHLKELYPFVELGEPETKGALHTQILEQDRIAEHRRFIAEQERIAKTYVPVNPMLSVEQKNADDNSKSQQALQRYLKDLQLK